MKLKLKIWRQPNNESKGKMINYDIDNVSPEELGVQIMSNIKTLSVAPPDERAAGIKVESVSELVEKLQTEAKVI